MDNEMTQEEFYAWWLKQIESYINTPEFRERILLPMDDEQ